MRYLILSDIHGNDEALSAVLAHVRRKRWDKTIVLGDVVGYGANPNQAIERVRSLKPLVAIRGNHDKVCSGVEDGEMFNRVALQAAIWTREHLTPSNLHWLRCDLETVLARVPTDGARPLAMNRDIMRTLLAEREPSYRMADVVVEAAGAPEQVAERVVALVRGRLRGEAAAGR